jgi:hypothetical protein
VDIRETIFLVLRGELSANTGVHELFKLLAVCSVDIDHHILVCVCVFGGGGGGGSSVG